MKTKTAKIFSAAFIAYLFLQAATGIKNAIYAITGLVQYVLGSFASAEVPNMQGTVVTGLINLAVVLISSVAYIILAVIVCSALIEKLGTKKEKLMKIRHLPGILYVLQVVLYIAGQIAYVFTQPQEYFSDILTTSVLNILPILPMRAVIAVLWFTLPAILLANELFVFKTKTVVEPTDSETE